MLAAKYQNSRLVLSGASRAFQRSRFHSLSQLSQEAQSAAPVSTSPELYQAAFEELQNGLKFYKVNKSLRELIYKPKNANRLLSMELYDEEEVKRITPQTFDGGVKKSAFNTLVLNSKSYPELSQAQKILIDFAKYNHFPKNKHYLKEEHFINLLIAGARLNKFPHVLTYLYSNNLALVRFLSFQVVEFIHVLNGIFKINASGVDLKALTLKEFIDKLDIPFTKLRRYKPKNIENALKLEPKVALTYISALNNYLAVKPKSKKFVEAKIAEVFKLLDLQKLEIANIAGIKASTFKPANHFEYVILKAIQEQFTKLAENEQFKAQATEVLNKVTPFVQSFEKALEAENKQNLYYRILEESKFGKPAKAAEDAAEEKA